MFDALFREARTTVDTALTGLVYRAAIGLILLVACGFATASFSIWINRQVGPETGNLVVAAIFLVLGLIVYLWLPSSSISPTEATKEASADADVEAKPEEASERMVSALDKELIYSAATAALPIALPKLMRLIMRNLPLLAALASAIYIMTRQTTSELEPRDASGDAAPGFDPAPAE